jgi:hypothetical protein
VSYLRKISSLAKDNIGGVLEIYVARKDDIDSIPAPIRKVIPDDIVFKAGAGFVKWETTFETSSFKSTGNYSREGASRNNVLEFTFPFDTELIRPMLEQAEDDELIVLYKFANKTKIFGSLESPVKFQFSHDTGENISDGNFNKGRFYSTGPDNSFFYSGTIDEAPSSTGTSRVEFSTGELIALLSPTDILVVSSDFTHTFTLIPGTGSALPAIVKWDTDEPIASLMPGDTLIVDTEFSFDFEIISTS